MTPSLPDIPVNPESDAVWLADRVAEARAVIADFSGKPPREFAC